MKEEKFKKKPVIKNPKIRVLGPVENLEENVNPEWWSRIFNSLYLKTDGDVVDDVNITKDEISQFMEFTGVEPDHRILDLCCGQGRHSIELATRGCRNVSGLDRSHYLIQKAKLRAKKEGLNIMFKEGDARKIPFATDYFDIVMILGNSFGYFEAAQDDLKVLSEVARVLKPWGKILIDVADGDFLKANYSPRSWEWINKKLFVCRERSLSADGDRLISRELISNVEKGVLADQFYAERLYTQESITQLLTKAGISNLNLHGSMSPNSQRNQDLGMMATRLIITGTVKKEWSKKRIKPKETVKNVGVLLGDPQRPDNLKPGCVFDEDDFYTIDQMKSALQDLKGYNITYYTNHSTLYTDLSKAKLDYVFNLCDEGLENDPRKELHVPALLETLKINYTGSNPQCLAYCYDKSLVRGIAKEMAIPVPEAFFIKPEDNVYELTINFPVLVKPNFGDSSFGITQKSVANNITELVDAISDIRSRFGYDKPILVEELLTGNDLSVGIIGNPPESYTVLPVIEEDYSELPPELPRICGYEAKWQPDSPYWNIKSIPAVIPEETRKFIEECCIKLFERLDCRDYCRFDWRLDGNGTPKLLEVNPNPGWCWDGHLAKMSALAGISYKEMLFAILNAAEHRIGLIPEDKSLQQ